MDENLSWNVHVDKIARKIASGISILKRSQPFVSFEVLLTIYNALVQPHFDYCSVVWGNCKKSLSTKLQKLQNPAAHILTYFPYDTSADGLFISLGWINWRHNGKFKQQLWTISLEMALPRNICILRLLIEMKSLIILLGISRAS